MTGGCGFIGSNFIRYCLENSSNTKIINVDALLEGSNKNNLKKIDKKRYIFKHMNTASKDISSLVKQSDVIINFAAESHVDRSIKNPKSFLENNVKGTFNLLEYVRKYDKRIIHISTDEIYGTAHGDISFKENDVLVPSNPYSASKAAADLYVQAYAHTYGISSCILRCTNNFGPYQFPEKFIPKSIIRALLDMPIPIYGSGTQERDWTFVEDFCSAILAVLKKDIKGKIYNVSSFNIYKNIEILEKILNLLEKPKSLIKNVEDRPGHDTRYSLDSSLIYSELGWKPLTPFEEALSKTVHWYKNNRSWWKNIANEHVLSETPWKSI